MKKRLFSLTLVILLSLTFLPKTTAFANEEETAVSLIFSKKTVVHGNTIHGSTLTENAGNYTAIFDFVDEDSDNETARIYDYGYNAYMDLGDAKNNWLNSDTAVKGKLTLSTEEITDSGYYKVDFSGSAFWRNTMIYVYVNGRYAGIFNGIDASITDTPSNPVSKTLNTVYINPTENGGKVYVQLRVAAVGNLSSASYLSVAGITFTKVAAPDFANATVSCEGLPELFVEDAEDVIVSPKLMVDGKEYEINGYNADATISENVNYMTVTSSDESIVKVSKVTDQKSSSSMRDNNGAVNKYTLTPVGTGIAELTVTAKVDGMAEPVVYTKKISVKGEVALNITRKYSFANGTEEPMASGANELLTYNDAGFEVVADKTTTASFGGGTQYINISGGTTSSDATTWVENDPDKTGSTIGQFTIKSDKIPQGTYAVSVSPDVAKNNRGGMVYVYVEGKYVGMYDSYLYGANEGTTDPIHVGYVSLDSSDIADGVEIMYTYAARSAGAPNDDGKTYKNNGIFIVVGPTTFTPVDKLPENGDIEYKVYDLTGAETSASSVAKGDSLIISGMLRGRHLNGYGADRSKDATNAISVTSSDENVIKVTDLKVAEDSILMYKYGGNSAYQLSAVGKGSATVTVKATVGGEVAVTESFEINVTSDEIGEEINSNISFSAWVNDESAGKLVSTDITEGEVESIPAGKRISISAIPENGYGFAYWTDSSGNFISGSPELSECFFTNTFLVAVFEKTEEKEVVGVKFFDGNKNYLGFEEVLSGTSFADVEKPANYGLTGYAFEKWSVDNDEIINSLINAVALYEEEGISISGSVTVNGNLINNLKYGDKITRTVENATAWYRDGNLVGYGDTYTYYVWDETSITSSVGATGKVPIVYLDDAANGGYMIEYDAGGFEILEAGIIFGTETHNTVSSCYYKAKVKNAASHGQFTAKKNEKNAEMQTVIRGYVVFRDAENSIRVIYD